MAGEHPLHDDSTYGIEPVVNEPSTARWMPHRDQPVELNHDLPCAVCGYNLRGLPRGGTCPECGTPIWRSLRGNMLEFASPTYAASLHHGTWLILASMIGWVLVMVLIILPALFGRLQNIAGPAAIERVVSLIGVGLAVVSLIGWWLFTAPDPGYRGTERDSRSRLVLRVTIVIAFVTTMLHAVNESAMQNQNVSLSLATFAGCVELTTWAVFAVHFFASLVYLRWLAPRFPDDDMDKTIVIYIWLLPVLFVVGFLACGIGPLITIVMYYLLINRVRLNLKHVREYQHYNAYGESSPN